MNDFISHHSILFIMGLIILLPFLLRGLVYFFGLVTVGLAVGVGVLGAAVCVIYELVKVPFLNFLKLFKNDFQGE